MNLRKNKNKQNRKPNLSPTYRNVPTNNYYRSPKTKVTQSSTENTLEKTNENKKFKISNLFNLILISGAVGLVVFATTLTTTPVIELRKTDAKYYESEVYRKAAEDAIKSNILNRSKIMFQNQSFENKLKEQFPEISQVKPIMPLGGRDLSVVITVSDPFVQVYSGADSGIVNADGVLVAKNTTSIPNDLLKLRFTEEQSNFSVGSRILTSDEVQLLKLLEYEMNDLMFSDSKSADISEVLFNVAQGQLEAKLKEEPFFIKLSTFNDSDVQVGGAKATLKQLDRENKLPTQYIDVRVPGRAFVL